MHRNGHGRPSRHTVLAFGMACALAHAETVSISTYGGDTATGVRESMIDPAAAKFGLSIRVESVQTGLPTVRLQVASKQPSWDIVVLGSDECAAGSMEGLFEKLDYSVIKTDGLPKEAVNPDWIAEAYVSTVLAWRTDKYKNDPPKSWSDFWNVKKYPGRRSMPAWASDSLPIAAMAAGARAAEVYPINTEAAFAKLAQIKPNIDVWWNSGGQAAQLMKDGEADIMAIWASRIPALVADGVPVGYTYQDGVLEMSCMAIIKGSKHVQSAQKLIALSVAAEQQANVPMKWIMCGPTNKRVFDTVHYPADVLQRTNSSPQNRDKQSLLSPSWWATNNARVEQRYKTLISD